jgi:hypothetical protein
MSVVRRYQNPNPVPSQAPSQSQSAQYQNTVTQNVQPVPNINADLDNVQWVRMGSGVKKINPGELVIFKPLSEVREIRNGTAWVVTAYVVEWRDPNGQLVLNNTIADIYMQTVLARKVKDGMTQYGSDNVYFRVYNKGKPQGRRYYDFDVEVGVAKNA